MRAGVGRKPAEAEKILEAACRVFSQKGYFSATVEDVMFSAGVGKGTVYRHFHSKEKLLLAALNRTSHEMSDRLLSAIRPGLPVRDQLAAAAREWLAYFAARPALLRVFVREGALSIVSVRSAMRKMAADANVRIARILGGASHIRAAAVFHSMVFGHLRQKLGFSDEKIDPDWDSVFLVDMFLNGFRGRRKS